MLHMQKLDSKYTGENLWHYRNSAASLTIIQVEIWLVALGNTFIRNHLLLHLPAIKYV